MLFGSVSGVWLVKLTLFCPPCTHPLICFPLLHSLERKKSESEEISEIPLLHSQSSAVRKSSSPLNNNHLSAKLTVGKVQSCVGVKNQFHDVQLLKSFLMLFQCFINY